MTACLPKVQRLHDSLDEEIGNDISSDGLYTGCAQNVLCHRVATFLDIETPEM